MAGPPVVWARCENTAHLPTLGDLAARLKQDGDDVLFLVTVRGGPDGHTPHPKGGRAVRAFIAEHKPLLTVLVEGLIDTNVLAACDEAAVPVVAIDSRPDTLREMTGGWFRAGAKPALADVAAAFAQDPRLIETLQKLGVRPDCAHHLGPWEKGAAILPFREESRQKTAEALAQRPVWFARGVEMRDVDMLVAAHRHASRQSLRLLMCVSPAIPMEGPDIADAMRQAGLNTGLRSNGQAPEEASQAYVTDLDGEDGLWMRLSPITFAAGTMMRGAAHDPFEAAALGSVVLHGRQTDPFADRFRRLIRAGASLGVADAEKLGDGVATLLAPDRTADMALAGWHVISSGAEISDRIIALIQDRLDRVGA